MRKSINAPSDCTEPQRTCVACRQVTAKRTLIRLVRDNDGTVDIDVSGKKNGRGCYLCRRRECWETALKSGRLERSLNVIIDQQRRERLVKAAAYLFPTPEQR